MEESLGRRPSLRPRGSRVIHAGPRVRIFEFVLVLHIVMIALALVFGWLFLVQDERWALSIALSLSLLAILALDYRRLRTLKQIREIAEEGHITTGKVLEARTRRFSIAPRLDRAIPARGIPFFQALEVRYAFETPAGFSEGGTFLAPLEDSSIWTTGRPVEIFYLPNHPEQNAASLVLRWYYRLGASTPTDDPPTGEFEEQVEVEWWE